MDTSNLLLIFSSALAAFLSVPVDALWCRQYRSKHWWFWAKVTHMCLGLIGSVIFLCLAAARRGHWTFVLAIWVLALKACSSLGLLLFFFREKISSAWNWFADLARRGILPIHEVPSRRSSGVSLRKSATSASSFGVDPGTPSSPVLAPAQGQPEPSVPGRVVLPGDSLESAADPAIRPIRDDISNLGGCTSMFTVPVWLLGSRGVGKTRIKDQYMGSRSKTAGTTILDSYQKRQKIDGVLYNVLLHDSGVARSDFELMEWAKRAVVFTVVYNEEPSSLEYLYYIALAIGLSPTTLVFCHQSEDDDPEMREKGRRVAERFNWQFVEVYPSSPDAHVEGIFADLIQRWLTPCS